MSHGSSVGKPDFNQTPEDNSVFNKSQQIADREKIDAWIITNNSRKITIDYEDAWDLIHKSHPDIGGFNEFDGPANDDAGSNGSD